MDERRVSNEPMHSIPSEPPPKAQDWSPVTAAKPMIPESKDAHGSLNSPSQHIHGPGEPSSSLADTQSMDVDP